MPVHRQYAGRAGKPRSDTTVNRRDEIMTVDDIQIEPLENTSQIADQAQISDYYSIGVRSKIEGRRFEPARPEFLPEPAVTVLGGQRIHGVSPAAQRFGEIEDNVFRASRPI